MSYPETRANIIRREDQRNAGFDPTSRTRFVATSDQTAGDFGLFEYRLNAGDGGPGAHFHTRISETFYVLEGELAVLDDIEWTTAHAGDLVYVPRRGVHGFRSASDEVGARFLILFTPGVPREGYFDGLIELRADGRNPTMEEIDELAGRFDQVNLRDRD